VYKNSNKKWHHGGLLPVSVFWQATRGLISSLLFSLLPYPPAKGAPAKKAQAKAWAGQKAGLKAGCNL